MSGITDEKNIDRLAYAVCRSVDVSVTQCMDAAKAALRLELNAILSTLTIAGEGKVKALAPVDVYRVLKPWADHGRVSIDHISAISREVAALTSSPGKDGGQEVEAVAHIVTDPKGKRRVTLATQYDPMASSFWEHGTMPAGYSVTPLYTRPQPASTALVEAPSPQSTVDADAVIERCALAADAEGSRWTKDEATTAFGQAYQHACANVSIAIRALKAKSQSSDRAASEGWQPIETAPDGEVVDLFFANGERLTGFKRDRFGRFCREEGYPTFTRVLLAQPTHWMRAPKDPGTGPAGDRL